MKTAFEKYTANVIHWLKKYGIDTKKHINDIMNLITDYFSNNETSVAPDFAAQCIKFEIKRGIGSSKFHGIRESVETDNDFIDTVLDEIFDMGENNAYNYYRNHRDLIKQFIEDGADPISVAKEIVNLYDANDDYEEDLEQAREDYNFEFGPDIEYEEDEANQNPDPDADFVRLRELHHSGKGLYGKPTGADGQAATPKDPIAYAVSKNDIESLEKYYKYGIPLSKITGDPNDTEKISWNEQYKDEFNGDNYRLMTCDGHNITSALDFMLAHTPDIDDMNVMPFPVPVFDLYNLFVSKYVSDDLFYSLLRDYCQINDNMDSELSYFDMPLKSLVKYCEYMR